VDEWGTWHPVEKGTNPAFLFQQNTIRDAIVAANTLDIFNRHADKVVMANIAQTINVLQAMILTQGEQILITPTGYVYEMYAPHQGAKSLRMRLETPEITFEKRHLLKPIWQEAMQNWEGMEGRLPVVAGSASLKDETLFVTLTNSHTTQAAEVSLDVLGGAEIGAAEGQILNGEIHAHNTFAAPEQLTPRPFNVDCKGSQINLVLPAAAVATIKVNLLGRNH
jgi:alpha-L-arabinofuranosidase